MRCRKYAASLPIWRSQWMMKILNACERKHSWWFSRQNPRKSNWIRWKETTKHFLLFYKLNTILYFIYSNYMWINILHFLSIAQLYTSFLKLKFGNWNPQDNLELKCFSFYGKGRVEKKYWRITQKNYQRTIFRFIFLRHTGINKRRGKKLTNVSWWKLLMKNQLM